MKVFATVLAGAWTATAFQDDVETFGVMIEDFDAWREDVSSRREMIYGGTDFRGAAWLDVSPGMTVAKLVDMVNHKVVDYEAYKDKVSGLINGALNNKVPEFKVYWNRDDGGRMYSQMQKSLRTSDSEMFVSAFYGGKMLDPQMTLRAAAVGPSSTLFLRRLKNVGQAFKESVVWRDVYVAHSYYNPDLDECTEVNQCRKIKMGFWSCEPMMNIVHNLASDVGITASGAMMKIKPKGKPQLNIKVDDLLFINQEVPAQEADFLYKRMKGMHVAINPTPFAGFWTAKHQRYDQSVTLVPFASLKTQYVEINDPKYDCACMDHANERIGHNLPRKYRDKGFGFGCGAHDQSMKYCDENKLDKGDRACWCPLQWCYTSADCGLPSKQFVGLYYSYGYCGNPVEKLKCYTADEEGAPEAKIEVMDIWAFSDLHRYLKSLVGRIITMEDAFDYNG